MVAKRLRALEASRYRRRQPLKAVGTRGEFWRKTPPSTFDKIFDKPQPPRVQRTQILARMITVSRLSSGFLRGLPAKNAIAHSACRLHIGVQRVKCPRAVMPDKRQQRSVPFFRIKRDGKLRQAACSHVIRAFDGAGQIRHRATFAACRLPAQRTSPPASDRIARCCLGN
jgi:hypothetical protein